MVLEGVVTDVQAENGKPPGFHKTADATVPGEKLQKNNTLTKGSFALGPGQKMLEISPDLQALAHRGRRAGIRAISLAGSRATACRTPDSSRTGI